MTEIESAFESRADEYDSWFDANQALYQVELGAVRELFPPVEKSLEVGVGSGRFAAALGIRTGVEPAESMAAIARSRDVEVISGKAENLPFAAGAFQAVLMVTAICFMDDVDCAFSEAFRVLESHGALVVAFIDRASSLGRKYAENKDKDPFYREARFYSVGEVEAALRKAGFRLEGARQTLVSDERVPESAVLPGHGLGAFVVLKAVKP